MINSVGTYEFEVEPFHVDFRGKLSMGLLGNHLLNTAGLHAKDRGFGILELNDHHYTWVLSRLAIEMNEMPYQDEKFFVKTWVENVYRLFTDRNFEILNSKRETIGCARSVWAMIDMTTRKPVDLLSLHDGNIKNYITQKDCQIEKPGRIKIGKAEVDSRYIIKYSDIDFNKHLNSIKYIEHILDLFPLELYKKKSVKRFEIAYVAESYYGDELTFLKEKVGEDEYNVEIIKNESDVVIRSKVIFI